MPSRAYQGRPPLQPLADAETSIFFDPGGERRRLRPQQRAKGICAHCPVTAECDEHVLSFGDFFGTWGGLSEDERHVLLDRPRRRAAPRPPTNAGSWQSQHSQEHAAADGRVAR